MRVSVIQTVVVVIRSTMAWTQYFVLMIHRQPMSLLFNVLHSTITVANPIDFGHATIFSFFFFVLFYFFFFIFSVQEQRRHRHHTSLSPTHYGPSTVHHHYDIDERTNGVWMWTKTTTLVGWKTISAKKLILDFYTIKCLLTFIITG